MSKLLKSLMQGEVKARFEGVDGGVFVSAQGLNSEKTYHLRKTLHEQGVKYTIVRNAFFQKAFSDFGYDPEALKGVLQGPLGVVYTNEENSAVTAAKALAAWKKEKKDKVILLQGAFMDGTVLNQTQATSLKDMPGKSEARAMLLGVMQAGITQLLATIREPHARVVYLLNSWKEKREEAGEKA